MRLGLLLLILIATLFGSGFWYEQIDRTCRVPIQYRIGSIDDRFGTNADEIRQIVLKAETIWEDPLRRELFIFDPIADISINLIYDERQDKTNKEMELRELLDRKEGMSESVAQQYDALLDEFQVLKKQYETRVATYEGDLSAYNTEVSTWNEKGGAPTPIVERLSNEEERLRTEHENLQAPSKKLNGIVAKLNTIASQGNLLVEDYNATVEEYNTHFGETHEFTQGDYGKKEINIYQFDSEEELTLVLAHEFGHALSIDHVDGDESVMYHLMEKQSTIRGLSESDIQAYRDVCEKKTGMFGFLGSFMQLF